MERGPAAQAGDLASRVEAHADWYHTLDLAPGVTTTGATDLRPLAARALPDDLSGVRALDVATFDGFWAFEMERRGAEVVAIDIDDFSLVEIPPNNRERLLRGAERRGFEPGAGFRIASEALGSSVRRVPCVIGDLEPDRVGGEFDLVFSGAILLHLRDPVGALERFRGVLRPGGELRLLEAYSLPLSILRRGRPAASFETLITNFNWWVPNLAALRAWMLTAGFERVQRLGRMRGGAGSHRGISRTRYALMRAERGAG